MQRRRFMKTGFAALAATGLPEVYNQVTYASRIGKRPSELRIVDIQRQTVKLPFRPAPQRAMDRGNPPLALLRNCHGRTIGRSHRHWGRPTLLQLGCYLR